MKRRSVGLILGCLLLHLLASSAGAIELEEIHKRASRAVVALKLDDATGAEFGEGTAFAVEGGLLVTNCHVAREASRIVAVLSAETRFEVTEVLACDEVDDLALLRARGATLEPLPLATDSGQAGQRVVVFGNPLGLAGTLSEGIVAAVRETGVGGVDVTETSSASPRLQISAPISPGSSGSPVISARGEVIGVVDSQYSYGQNLNFAVPVERLRVLLREGPKSPRALSGKSQPGTTYVRNVLISLALFAVIGYLLMRK